MVRVVLLQPIRLGERVGFQALVDDTGSRSNGVAAAAAADCRTMQPLMEQPAVGPLHARPRTTRPSSRRWAATALALLALQTPPPVAADTLRPAPPLSATLLDGRSFNLAHSAGKVLIVNFWATWCAPCRQEMPALEAFRLKYRERGLEVLAISLDAPRDIAAVRSALQGYGFAAALATEAAYAGYGRIWRLPTTFVIDRDGRLRSDLPASTAALDAAWLERHVAPLLGS